MTRQPWFWEGYLSYLLKEAEKLVSKGMEQVERMRTQAAAFGGALYALLAGLRSGVLLLRVLRILRVLGLLGLLRRRWAVPAASPSPTTRSK